MSNLISISCQVDFDKEQIFLPKNIINVQNLKLLSLKVTSKSLARLNNNKNKNQILPLSKNMTAVKSIDPKTCALNRKVFSLPEFNLLRKKDNRLKKKKPPQRDFNIKSPRTNKLPGKLDSLFMTPRSLKNYNAMSSSMSKYSWLDIKNFKLPSLPSFRD